MEKRNNRYSNMISEILMRTPESVLDIGGGSGELVKVLEEKGVKAVCVDSSEECWDNRVTESFIRHNMLVTPWPFEDKHFDLCTGFGVLKYIPEERMESVLHEMERVTNRGFFGIGRGIEIPPSDCGEAMTRNKPDWWTTKFAEVVSDYPVSVVFMGSFRVFSTVMDFGRPADV